MMHGLSRSLAASRLRSAPESSRAGIFMPAMEMLMLAPEPLALNAWSLERGFRCRRVLPTYEAMRSPRSLRLSLGITEGWSRAAACRRMARQIRECCRMPRSMASLLRIHLAWRCLCLEFSSSSRLRLAKAASALREAHRLSVRAQDYGKRVSEHLGDIMLGRRAAPIPPMAGRPRST